MPAEVRRHDGLRRTARRSGGAAGALQKEKARQNRLIAAGYTVPRFTWQDIRLRPDAVAREVSAALARAASWF